MARYPLTLEPTSRPPPILADFPEFVEPLQSDRRFEAPPLVNDSGGTLRVRAWRWWYNARGIVEMDNRLQADATAIIVVHPWGVDDGHGLRTPEPAGIAFFCTEEKNQVVLAHMRQVLKPFLHSIRAEVALVGYSLPGSEDPVRKRLYASIVTTPDRLEPHAGERALASVLERHRFTGAPRPAHLDLSAERPVCTYFEATPATDAGDHYNGTGFWRLPMPIAKAVEHRSEDLVFYDGEGYPKVRDYLLARGIRHILLAGYATDMCVARTTCGYENLSADFNVFLVGDATLATFPASRTPRFATQAALANAALSQLITQVSWIRTGTLDSERSRA